MYYIFFVLLSIILDGDHLLGGMKVLDFLGLGILFAGCLKYLPIRYAKFHFVPVVNTFNFLIYFLYLAILIISFWRTNSFLSTSVNIFKVSAVCILLPLLIYFVHQDNVAKGKSTGKELLVLMIHVLGIFCLLNLLFVIAKPTFEPSSATVFKIVGISTRKIVFSMYEHVHPNSLGILGGYLMVMCTGFLMNVKSEKFTENGLFKIYIFFGFVMLLIGDSRGTFFSAILCIFILYFISKTGSFGLLKLSVFILPLSHIIFIFILQNFADSEIMSNISRNSSELATGNSRKFIYAAANEELSEMKPIHFVGFGEYGIYGAGITEKYVNKFGELNEKKRLMVSVAHNSALQAIIDVGYLGITVYIILLFIVFHQVQILFNSGNKHFMVMSYFLVFHLITGISESNFGKYWKSPFFMFLYMALIVLLSSNYVAVLKEKKSPVLQ